MTEPRRWYYCVIQYCPDHGRAEAANVGVLLFSPCYRANVIMDFSMGRVERFFGSEHKASAKLGMDSVAARLADEAVKEWIVYDLDHFISTRANVMQLTPPRPIRCHKLPKDECWTLYNKFVAEPKQRKAR